MGVVSLDPDREPITWLVSMWLDVAARLAAAGDRALATAIQEAMDGRQLNEAATFPLTVAEQRQVSAVLHGWRDEQDPD